MDPMVFLGVPIPTAVWRAISPGMHRLFGEYVETQEDGDVVYAGRSIEGSPDLESLELVRAHLDSVLRKLLPPGTPLVFSCHAYLREDPITVAPTHTYGISPR